MVVRDGAAMVAQMDPALVPGGYAFVTCAGTPSPAWEAAALCRYQEAEGLSLILPAEHAPDAPVMRCITLQVHSALDGVGLTAAVSGALAEAGIPANVVAAFHHDHVFVPEAQAEAALGILRHLSAASAPEAPAADDRPQAVATVLLDDERVRVTRYDFAPGAETGWHVHGLEYVITTVTDCVLELELPGGETARSEVPAGSAYRRPVGTEHNVINGGTAPMSFVEVELKPQ